jgi:hypothetical protein
MPASQTASMQPERREHENNRVLDPRVARPRWSIASQRLPPQSSIANFRYAVGSVLEDQQFGTERCGTPAGDLLAFLGRAEQPARPP